MDKTKRPVIQLDQTPRSADWLKKFDPVELGLPVGTTPEQAAEILHLDPSLPSLQKR